MDSVPSSLSDPSVILVVAGAIGGGLLLYVVERTLDVVRGKASAADLQRANLSLQSENATLQAKVSSLEEQVRQEKSRVAAYESKQALFVGLDFQVDLGTYLDGDTGVHYCPSCLNGAPASRSPMFNSGKGWKCQCGHACDDREQIAEQHRAAKERLTRAINEHNRR